MLLLVETILYMFPFSSVLMTIIIPFGLEWFLSVFFFIFSNIADLLHLPSQNFHHKHYNKQKPVNVHDKQGDQKGVEKKVEGDVGDSLLAGDAGSIQHFQWKPVQPEPEPGDTEAHRAHVGKDVVYQVVAATTCLEVDVEFGELQLDIIDVVEEQNKNTYVVVSECIGEGDQRQSDDVMQHHDFGVFPPCIHVHCGVDGVAVKAPLDQIGDCDIRGHRHPALPVIKHRWRVLEERVVGEEEKIRAVGP